MTPEEIRALKAELRACSYRSNQPERALKLIKKLEVDCQTYSRTMDEISKMPLDPADAQRVIAAKDAERADMAHLSDDQRADVLAHIEGLRQPGEDATYDFPTKGRGWVCFHCGQRFVTPEGAELHFGVKPDATPSCLAAKDVEIARLREGLRPFAAIAEHDIGADEADTDRFRPSWKYNRAPHLTVVDFRRILALLTETSNG